MKVDNKDTGSRMARKETSTARTGASDESIGRPANWQEGAINNAVSPSINR